MTLTWRRFSSRVVPFLILLALLPLSCDEDLNAIGGSPGGDPNGFWDSVNVVRANSFPADQPLRYADVQFVGNLDELEVRSHMLVHFEYQLPDTISIIPDTVSVDSIVFSMRMDNDSSRVVFGPDQESEFSERDLDFLLIRDIMDGDDVRDSLLWDRDLYGNGAYPEVLDSVRLTFRQQERIWGDLDGDLNVDPETGTFSTRGLGEHHWWFTTADQAELVPDSSPPRYRRSILIKMPVEQQGMLAFLGQGWTSSLRPGYRLYFQDYWIDSELGLQDTTTWAFQSSVWQNSVVKDDAGGESLTLNSTSSWQISMVLPPFLPTLDGVELNPATTSILKAWLRLPIASRDFNALFGTVHLYAVDAFEPDTLNLNDAKHEFRLFSTEILDGEEETTLLEFSLVNYLVQHWTGRNDFDAEDSLRIALRFNVNDLELRRLRLWDPASADSLKPRLVYKMTQAPEPWGAQ